MTELLSGLKEKTTEEIEMESSRILSSQSYTDWQVYLNDRWFRKEDVLAFLEEQEKDTIKRWLEHCDSCIHKKEIESEWRGKIEQLKKWIEESDWEDDSDIINKIDEVFGSLVDVHNPEFGGKALHVDMLDKESGLKEKPLLPKVSSADAKQETKKELVCMDKCFECDKNCNADNHGLYRTEVFGCEKPKIICPSCESKGAVLLANISCPRCEGKGYKEISSADAKGEAKE